MQLFQVLKTQETKEIKEYKKIGIALKSNPDKVFIIIDDDKRNIWLYKGADSSIVLQFIGVSLQKQLKKLMRGFYHIEQLNDLNIDDKEYKKIFDSKITEGRFTEINRPKNDEKTEDLPAEKTKQQEKIKFDVDSSRAKEICVHKRVIAKDVIPKIIEMQDPTGFHRHMTLIGNGVYAKDETVEKFIIEDKKTTTLKKIGNLPNGLFFLENVSARLILKGGQVQAMDLMVKNNEYLGDNKLMVPLFFKSKLHREGDMKILLSAFKKPSE